MKVIASQTSCIGAGQCVLSAPNVFAQREGDGKVELLAETPGPADQGGAREVALLCPSASIDIEEDDA